jgi:hypothetical protein
MKKTPADNFYNALKDNPKEIIKWCRAEIKEYERLIKLLSKKSKASDLFY